MLWYVSETLVELRKYFIILWIKAVSCWIMWYYLIYDISINMALYSLDDFLISATYEFDITKLLKYTSVFRMSWKDRHHDDFHEVPPRQAAIYAVFFLWIKEPHGSQHSFSSLSSKQWKVRNDTVCLVKIWLSNSAAVFVYAIQL